MSVAAEPPVISPVISDADFEAALPPVGDDLDAPLAPLPATPAPSAPAPVASVPAPSPAGAEPVPSLPPELGDPLPPLGSFALDPPAGLADATAPAETLRYRLEVEGLNAVGLERRFRSLSALDRGDGDAANGAVVLARAREDEQLALSLLRAEGYYDATASVAIEPPAGDRPLVARLRFVAGGRYRLGRISVTGPDTDPPGLARAALGLKGGEPLVAAAIEAAEANVSVRLPERGYPFATLGARDVLLDPETRLGDYTLPVDPGPLGAFGSILTSGRPVFDAAHVAVLARFRSGDRYDGRKVDDLRDAMIATGLMSGVAVTPVATERRDAEGRMIVDLNVTQQAGPPRTIAAQGGYQTGQGLTLRGSWTHRNLFPPEGALIVQGVIGTREQSAGVSFRRANAGRRDRTVELGLRGARQRYEAYDALTASLSARISRESTPLWQKIWTWAYGFELLASDEDRRIEPRDDSAGTYFIVALPTQLGYDRSNSLLDPTRGFRVTGRLTPELSQRVSGDFDRYARGIVDVSGYYPVRDDLVIAARARFGTIVGAPRDRIAPSRRLYAGGGGSVRGFGFQELGPRDADNAPIGGRSVVEAAVEARYRFGDYGIAAFVDAGQVYRSSLPGLSDIRAGVGIGGRLYTNFGPIRVDVATPLARRPGESRITLFISIGQAF
ncbi:autotransporter assembly complex protein TamA [Sphingomonas changnyeongensis]|uniref:autotransporter assembly complex protein TamA n=1 Tax=Sphingomonas changnyeongensis TaxID=2698679 RepID=UPI001E58C0A1|nr:BamA/TamA family outer membrane protein [Sphingomonas changnyeongensis]